MSGRLQQLTLAVSIAMALGACTSIGSGADAQPSNMTQGMVQLTLEVGKTTKANVLDVFGAPNITTRDGAGREVWSYQRHATVSRGQKNFVTIFLAGATATGFEKSSRTMTLIIKFDDKDVVVDFDSMYTSF
jgi:outer membrane protein assembly factor BamE (lipoprotein component of BamABCDE complex)